MIYYQYGYTEGLPGCVVVKNPPASAGDARDLGSIPGSGRCPGEGNGNPFQYSCLENPTDRGVWWASVQGVTKSQTRLGAQVRTHTHTHTHLAILIIQL